MHGTAERAAVIVPNRPDGDVVYAIAVEIAYGCHADAEYMKNNHASAWHLDLADDVRSLMSVEPNDRWWMTVHHELGHIFYYQAYSRPEVPPLLRRGANVLLLDEPTNDLDVETLRALEEALLTFAGTVLVISHDRWFLDRVATHIMAFEGDSHVEWFEGNFTDYEADRKRRLGDAQPTRVKYKPIHR